jgi:hypothetical protein
MQQEKKVFDGEFHGSLSMDSRDKIAVDRSIR